MKQFSLPRKKKIRNRKQFKAVFARDLCASNGLLTVCVAENDCGYPRLGVSISKSCGGAVVRNRLKRLLRETFRQNQSSIPPGFDYLLMISPRWSKRDSRVNTRQPTLEQVKTSFLDLLDALVRKKRTKNGG
ncbi:MAG: ribonuclease P protein component [Planctomycetota bacterium]|nr:ribonuclease P protein component [Planctomycetota bacterium]